LYYFYFYSKTEVLTYSRESSDFSASRELSDSVEARIIFSSVSGFSVALLLIEATE